MMNFWAWLLRMPGEEDDWKSSELLKKEKQELQEKIKTLELEVAHWKTIALNFRKHHQ